MNVKVGSSGSHAGFLKFIKMKTVHMNNESEEDEY